MFDRGADAVGMLAPELGRVYVCPVCLEPFDQDDLDKRTLTLEDVPPKALGGKPMMLTCKPCNNTAGARLDAEWRNRQNLVDFLEGRLETPLKGQVLRVGDTELPVSVTQINSRFEFLGAPQAAHPDMADSMMRQFADWAADGTEDWEFQLSGFGHRPREANLSVLRMAYLVCFALWGYSFISHDSLSLVRHQLNNIDEDVFDDSPVASFNQKAPRDSRVIVRVAEPVAAILVNYGRYSGLVPLPGSDPNPYAVLESGKDPGFSYTGVWPWPARLELRLDFDLGRT